MNNITITNNLAEERFGAFFNETLLDKEEFISAVRKKMQDSKVVTHMIQLLNNIQQCKNNNGRLLEAVEKWGKFEEIVLQNKEPTGLMIVANFDTNDTYTQLSSKQTSIYTVNNQNDILTKSGSMSMSQIKKSAIQAQKDASLEKLSLHYNSLIQTLDSDISPLETQLIERDDYIASTLQKQEIRNRYYNNVLNDKSYRYIIYGGTGWLGHQFRGQVADAFLNHLGSLHQSLFDGKSFNISPLLKQSFARSVQHEEGNHFLQLLINSTNNTNWMSGGDLNLIDASGKRIASIQLKTIVSQERQIAGHLSHVSFYKMIDNLCDQIKNNQYEAVAQYLWSKLKTSGIVKQGQKLIGQATTAITENLTK